MEEFGRGEVKGGTDLRQDIVRNTEAFFTLEGKLMVFAIKNYDCAPVKTRKIVFVTLKNLVIDPLTDGMNNGQTDQ